MLDCHWYFANKRVIDADKGTARIKVNFGDKPFVTDFKKIMEENKIKRVEEELYEPTLTFWRKTIKTELEQRYPSCLSEDEKNENFNLLYNVDMPLVIQRFQILSGIRLSSFVEESWQRREIFDMTSLDVEGLISTVSYLGLVDYSEALSIYSEVESSTGMGKNKKVHLLEQALQCMNKAATQPVFNALKYLQWGRILMTRAKIDENSSYFEEAVIKFNMSFQKWEFEMKFGKDIKLSELVDINLIFDLCQALLVHIKNKLPYQGVTKVIETFISAASPENEQKFKSCVSEILNTSIVNTRYGIPSEGDCEWIVSPQFSWLHDFIVSHINTKFLKTSLHLCGMGPKQVELLSHILSRNEHVEGLSLKCNKIADKGAIVIADSLRKNNKLTDLNLNETFINDNGATVLAESLQINKTLTKLFLSGVFFLSCLLIESNVLDFYNVLELERQKTRTIKNMHLYLTHAKLYQLQPQKENFLTEPKQT
eukprot:TRINITY_DN10130_c0_g1_i10.p1 TRINITY_DN10130_c0_g1~~TRINITY_DN10130_c0_g1_i10.p1  ORF type:complete len:483 (+),score=98.03 TRINITY_DN10130_c0_g1_i10:1283-2731(+)